MYARYDPYDDTRRQLLVDHIEGVRQRCQQRFPKSTIIELASILHDYGKAADQWGDYLLNPGIKKVSHSLHGIGIINKLSDEVEVPELDRPVKSQLVEIISFLIGAHHGLFDFLDPEGVDRLSLKFERGLSKDLDEVLAKLEPYYPYDDLKQLFKKAIEELKTKKNEPSYKELSGFGEFRDSIIIRMYLSALIDSDWSDAASFTKTIYKELERSLDSFPWESLLNKLKDRLSSFSKDHGLNDIRHAIGEECESAGQRSNGIYQLEVPTGAGKTLSVMRFALKHASLEKKDRIFYIAPFISILEQNADEYRTSFGKEYEEFILEHHSNIREDKDEGDEGRNNIRRDFYQENWSAPIILTTMVRLLNVMFSGNKQDLRRMHRLKNSVLIIDEVQSLPAKTITLFNGAINVLSKLFNCTVVLCSATQPPFKEKIKDVASGKGIIEIHYAKTPMLTQNYSEHSVFKRVDIISEVEKAPWNMERFKNFCKDEFETVQSMLVVLNTRDAVRLLYDELKGFYGKELVVLSNNMVPEHRLKAINEVKRRLSAGERVLCISTTLIEAGVDISVEKVIRSLTGLDSAIQAAGRCNRHGELNYGVLKILWLDKDIENIDGMPDLIKRQMFTKIIIRDYLKNPTQFSNGLLSSELLEKYYLYLLKETVKITHYPVRLEQTDVTIYDLMSSNLYASRVKIKENRKYRQALKTAGKLFKPIEQDQKSVLVEYDQGKVLIGSLLSGAYFDPKAWKELQRYSINLYQNKFEELMRAGQITLNEEYGIYILKDGNYDDVIGLATNANFHNEIY